MCGMRSNVNADTRTKYCYMFVIARRVFWRLLAYFQYVLSICVTEHNKVFHVGEKVAQENHKPQDRTKQELSFKSMECPVVANIQVAMLIA